MRYQGKVQSWNDAKGYGFVQPNCGGDKAFLHVSAFTSLPRRPIDGDLVAYEVQQSSKGLRATNAAFVEGHGTESRARSLNSVSLIVGLLIVAAIGYILSIRLTHPNSTIAASVYKATSARSALNAHTQYQCESKRYCSQMTSCAEAFFYQERCGATEMDGDHDGIPCEQQLCR